MTDIDKLITKDTFFLDFETNGFGGDPIEIGLYNSHDESKNINEIIYTDQKINKEAQKIHQITQSEIKKGKKQKIIFKKFTTIAKKGSIIVAHNCSYEKRILKVILGDDIVNDYEFICTKNYAKNIHNRYKVFGSLPKTATGLPSFTLQNICQFYKFKSVKHRAFDDAVMCYKVLKKLINYDKDLHISIVRTHIFMNRPKPLFEKKIVVRKGTTKMKIKDIMSIINSCLDDKCDSVKLECELVSIKTYPYLTYMTLSDSSGSIDAICKKYKNNLQAGDKISIKGKVVVYSTKDRSKIQVDIKEYEKVGTGDKHDDLKKLTEKLKKEGLFNNNRPIRNDYLRIGLITSLNAAGLKDMISTMNSRMTCGNIVIYDSIMQGDSAPRSMINSIKKANDHDFVEVLAIARGGGGKEDLRCFNDEKLARAIYASKIPVVTGIGHDIDRSLADLVADKEFITPTAVAEGITYNKDIIIESINMIHKNIIDSIVMKFKLFNMEALDYQTRVNDSFSNIFSNYKTCLDMEKVNIKNKMKVRLHRIHNEYNNATIRLNDVNPAVMLKDKHVKCSDIGSKIRDSIQSKIMSENEKLAKFTEIINNKGKEYKGCVIMYKGRVIRSKKEFSKLKRKTVNLLFDDGSIELTVKIN